MAFPEGDLGDGREDQVRLDPGRVAEDLGREQLGVAAGPDDPGIAAQVGFLAGEQLADGADDPPEDAGLRAS